MKNYIIAFILFVISLFSINEVFAATSPYWGSGSDIIHPLVVAASDCGNGNCGADLNASFRSVNNNNGIYYFDSTTSTSMSSNGAGVLWTYQPNTTLKSNYLYSLTTYICHSSSANIVYKGLYANTSVSNVQKLISSTTVYSTTFLTNLNTTPFSGVAFTKCGFINNIFKSNNNSKYVGVNYTLDASASNYKTYLIGYSIDSLGDANGLTSSDIQNVINGSGLATANDIDSLQDSVDDIQSSLNSMNDSINNVNDTLNNSDSSGATSDAGNFFSGFTTNTFGLTSIITSPLNLINSLTSKTCSSLRLQIPFVNQNLDLPCMTTIYQQHFGTFLTIYQTITFGIISYWVCIRIFALVKDFKNPDHDEIEVMDL